MVENNNSISKRAKQANLQTTEGSQSQELRSAITALLSHHPIVIPTDTVYGIATLATSQAAIEKLFQAKRRPLTKGIPVMIADITDLPALTPEPIAPETIGFAQKHWPGALTLIVPKKAGLPPNLSPNDKIAVRIPDYPLVRELIRQVGRPLAVTSANISGEPSATTAEEAQAQLGNSVTVYINDGISPLAKASTILDCTQNPPKIVREGSLTTETLGLHL